MIKDTSASEGAIYEGRGWWVKMPTFTPHPLPHMWKSSPNKVVKLYSLPLGKIFHILGVI